MTATMLRTGDLAPDFELVSDSGAKIRLSDLRGQQVVLYFYPRDNTSGCTTQAIGFRDAFEDFEREGAVVLGISPDDQASHASFRAKLNLPFHLLVDADHAVAELYGVWGEKSMYGRKFMGIVRSHFVIDAEGRIADSQRKISPKQSVEKALETVAQTAGQAAE
jgi:peroxiredoxin Q/BCP